MSGAGGCARWRRPPTARRRDAGRRCGWVWRRARGERQIEAVIAGCGQPGGARGRSRPMPSRLTPRPPNWPGVADPSSESARWRRSLLIADCPSRACSRDKQIAALVGMAPTPSAGGKTRYARHRSRRPGRAPRPLQCRSCRRAPSLALQRLLRPPRSPTTTDRESRPHSRDAQNLITATRSPEIVSPGVAAPQTAHQCRPHAEQTAHRAVRFKA